MLFRSSVNSPSDATAADGGITLLGTTDKILAWNATDSGQWYSNQSIRVKSGKEVRFGDADDSNYLGLKAPATVTVNKVWTLPATDGTTGQVLKTDGSAALGWQSLATVATSGSASDITTGTLPVAQGGTGATSTTGSGANVLATSPTLTTPTIGAATATTINKVTITAPTTSATLTIADGKTLTANNSITLAGTDATTITLPSTSGTVPLNNQTMYVGTTALAINRASASQSLTGITSIDGSAATLTTARTIYGNSFNGSANLTQIIASTYGGTGNGFTKFSGATTAEKTYTLPDATCSILTDNTAVTAAQGGTGQTSYTTGDILYASGSTALSKLAAGTSGYYLKANGAGIAPSWASIPLPTDLNITSQAQGDILYFNGTNWVRLAAGTSGQYLKTQGAAANPTWASVSTSAPVTSDLQLGTTGYTTPSYTTRNNNDTSTPIQIWVQDIDSNNQGVYARIKKNGSYVNVQIA